MKNTTANGPLQGLRVLELGHYVAGPHCTHLLADLGAEVIKIEPPEGDPLRQLGAKKDGHSLWWSSISRNKQCIAVDLRTSEGRQIVRDIVPHVDVVVENFRAGQLEHWELGWDHLRAINPRLVMTRISGFGQDGPYSDRVAFAVIGESYGGLRYITGPVNKGTPEPPVRSAISLGDSIAGTMAAFGTLAAVHEIQRAGERAIGRCVDVAMYEAVFSMLESMVTDFDVLGEVRQPSGSSLPTVSPSNIYRCADDSWIAISVASNPLFRRLALAMERPDILDRAEFADNSARVAHREALDGVIGQWMQARSGAEAERWLQDAGIPASRIFSIDQCATDPHYLARDAVTRVSDPLLGNILQPGIFPKFTGSNSPAIGWTGAPVGAHTAAVLEDLLNYSRDDIAHLARTGAIKAPSLSP